MSTQVIPARKLLKTSVRQFWQHKATLIVIAVIIELPLTVLAVLGVADPVFLAYSSFLRLIMNLAIIWSVIQLCSGRQPTVGQAYYQGTFALVRLLLLTACFFFMMAPFLIGGLFYVQGVTGSTVAASGPEKLLLGIIWLILTIPSAWLMARFSLSVFGLVEHNLTPIAALAHAAALAKRRTRKILARLTILGFSLVIVLAIPAFIIALVGLRTVLANLAMAALQLASVLILLPIINFYLYNLYRDLGHNVG